MLVFLTLSCGLLFSCSVSHVAVLIQGDGSTLGSTVVLDGRVSGTMQAVEGTMPDIYIIDGTVDSVGKAIQRRVSCGPGYAECRVRALRGVHVFRLVSVAGDTLEARVYFTGNALVRASFVAGGVQALEGS